MPDLPASPAIANTLETPDVDGVSGVEWIVDALDCRADDLRDPRLITQICERIVCDLQLKVIGEPQVHHFPDPGGVTALYLLSESHLACHTYPEFRLATLNLYCCGARRAWDWQDNLARALGASRVDTKRIARGLGTASGGDRGRHR